MEPSLAEKFKAKERAWARGSKLLFTRHELICGDARQTSQLISQRDVHLVVTSPPYWDLKQYGADRDGQLGHIANREEFLEATAAVWRECYGLLVPGGRLCIVVGDVLRSRRAFGRHVLEPLHSYLQVQCQQIGLDPLAPIIWNKIGNMATEVAGNGNGFLGKPYEPNAIIKNDIEYILLFRKPGGYRHPTQEQRDLSTIDRDDYRRWFVQVWGDVPGEVRRDHPAPFPEAIARRLISMFSFVGDTVLDPFVGTGTVSAAAMALHRSSVGVDIDDRFITIASDRIESLVDDTTTVVASETFSNGDIRYLSNTNWSDTTTTG